MKTNIKMRVTSEQSKRVQEICFENKIFWIVSGNTFCDYPLIYIKPNVLVADTDYEEDFEEIDADLFIRTNGSCEEPIGSKFQPSDKVIRSVAKVNGWDKLETSHYTMNMLLDKLKKKNEILTKARIKRKNQREELHKLNLKLQKCITLEEHNKIMQKYKLDLLASESELLSVKSHNERLNEVARNINDLLGKQIDIKDNQDKEIEKLKTVIEYLESKAK